MTAVSLILAPTFRSRAIVQVFASTGIKVESAIILPDQEPVWDGEILINTALYEMDGSLDLEPGKPVAESLAEQGIPFTMAPTNDVNTQEFIDFIKEQDASIYVYSGVAGCILRSDLLRQSGKKFIHAHGGDAPRYSGSTSFYYSLLEAGFIGATVFWVDEGLDTGDVLAKLVAPPHRNIEMDRVQDPLIRAEALAIAISALANDEQAALEQDHSQRVTYHVIHPVLKHLALRKIN